MGAHYEKVHRAHEMGFLSTAHVGEFLESTIDNRERILAQLVDNLLTETLELNSQIRGHRDIVTELLYSSEVQSIAPSPVLMALMERIRVRLHIDDNIPQ